MSAADASLDGRGEAPAGAKAAAGDKGAAKADDKKPAEKKK